MEPISDGCRLCLDPFAENFTTIDSPELKDQMEKVFRFPIEPEQGYSSGVCQSCSYAISEFYQYSEKVRQNQELLNGNATSCDLTIDSKITLENAKIETLSGSGLPEITEDTCESKNEVSGVEEVPTKDSKITLDSVKIETLSDSGLPEMTEDTCEPIDEVTGEEVSKSGDDELYKPAPKKSQTKRKGNPRSKLDYVDVDEPTKISKQTSMKSQQERNKQDQLFNKHFSMICDLCKTSTATFTELSKHFYEEHKRRGYVVCCNKKLFDRYVILGHINFHANPDVFRCEVCGNKYKTKKILNEHMFCMHSSTGPLKCDFCPQGFTEKSALAKHMERHVKVKCPKCDKMLASKFSLSYHMITQHSGKERTLVCDTCGQKFLTKQYFDQHMNKHMGIEVQRFQCGICQRWLKGRKNLRHHMNTQHTDGDEEFQCDICLKKFKYSQALYKHKVNMHTGRMHEHECEFCGKKFKRAISLKDHRSTHTGEVLYTCEYCGVSKNSRRNLQHHVKRQHPTEWTQKKLMVTQSSGPS